LVAVVSGAIGRMECLDKCGVNGWARNSDVLSIINQLYEKFDVFRHTWSA